MAKVTFRFLFCNPLELEQGHSCSHQSRPLFHWTAQQVAKLGGHKQAIYIVAKDKLVWKEDQVSTLACAFAGVT